MSARAAARRSRPQRGRATGRTHQAIRFHEPGGLDRLELEDVPTPTPDRHEVLVRVRAATVNHLDLDMLAGTSRYEIPLPHTLGMEGAGVVEEVGSEATQFRAGDRVLVATDVVCGRCEACRSGYDNVCSDAIRPGWTVPGAYAELMLAPASGIYRLSEGVSFEQAAVAQVSLGTAWHMLVTRGRLVPGEWVLVNGAAGGVGTGALSVAAFAGARVIAATSSPEKGDQLLELGAEAVADYSRPDFVDQVWAITGGRGIDLAFDFVGGELLQHSLDCLRHDGRLVICGAHGGEMASVDLVRLFRAERRVIGSNSATADDVRRVLDLVGRARLRVPIAARFPLDGAAAALAMMQSRRHVGRILLIT